MQTYIKSGSPRWPLHLGSLSSPRGLMAPSTSPRKSGTVSVLMFLVLFPSTPTHLVSIPGLPVPGTKIEAALRYGMSLWGEACKIEALLPSGERRRYLLKVSASFPTLILSQALRGTFVLSRSCPTA